MSNTPSIADSAPLPDETRPYVPEAFCVSDDRSANWIVRRVTQARRYRTRVEEWAAAEIRRAEHEEAFFLTRYGNQLEVWLRATLATTPRRRSVALPAGVVGLRARVARIVVIDESSLINWCQKVRPDAIKTNLTVLKTVLQQHLQTTGEVPPGVELGEGGERFFIR